MATARVILGPMIFLAVGCIPTLSLAAPPSVETVDVVRAREQFVKGSGLAKEAQWAEALAAFEQSSALRPHPVTTYDIGVCQRAMGNYNLARTSIARALVEDTAAGGGQLAPSLVAEAKGFLSEIDALVATATVSLNPPNATVVVDGRPLEPQPGTPSPPILVAGVRSPGPGEAPPAAVFRVLLDPGAHVFTFVRKGFADIVLNKAFAPGAHVDLKFELDRLPATLRIASSPTGAVVTVEGVDVGTAPVEVSRPGGSYEVTVRKHGFKNYQARVVARPGEAVDLDAALVEDKPSLTQRWWFWTAAGVVVAGAAVGTYFLTRPETPAPPLNGGGLGWTAQLQQ